MIWPSRTLRGFVFGVGLLVTHGCQPENPNGNVEPPIITDDAPKSSEEAAARSEPPVSKSR
ncbi:hypothetical protein Sinac_2857 [Singulisphaera acidiphila DSM 18658]|uniref:Uncharacterized protein n=1 Tax=Singulisphaera acidiphila (strain ATCC BAA-1392 / DSM 18658 / VKM B-2454 / MOB10) TaxID=886293 RepID=L0DCP6_SINAD|nr:hypothetical protein Sinac_2857 [Singulisphaera acidiphila DSM 18658]